MKKIYNQHVIFLASLVLFFGLTVVGFLFFMNSVMIKIEKTREITNTLANTERDRNKYQAESDQFGALKERIQNLNSKIPSQSNISNILSSMEARAMLENLNFQIQSVTINTKEQKMDISFNAAGDIHNVQAFLDSLFHLDFPISFRNFSLSLSSLTEEGGSVSGNEWVVVSTISVPSADE